VYNEETHIWSNMAVWLLGGLAIILIVVTFLLFRWALSSSSSPQGGESGEAALGSGLKEPTEPAEPFVAASSSLQDKAGSAGSTER
jgi:hypothetical protein